MAEIKVGQQWREVDPRFDRVVTVVGFDDPSGKVVLECAGKRSKAKRERFNGKRGGYALVSEDAQ